MAQPDLYYQDRNPSPLQLVWYSFRERTAAMIALWFLIILGTRILFIELGFLLYILDIKLNFQFFYILYLYLKLFFSLFFK